VLADGTSVRRASPWARRGTTVGEAVFTTGMTGYQEVLTDPSYCGQIVVP
jgi:carbamoyl-phosphate synthase small subunit